MADEQTGNVQDAPAQSTTDAQPQSQGASPWASDLASTFQDESVRQQVDVFLGSKIQPYVTRLEKDRAEAARAVSLYNDLREKPLDTYLEVTDELFEDDPQTAKAIREYLTTEQDSGEDFDVDAWLAEEGIDEGTADAEPPIHPKVAAFIQEQEDRQRREQYQAGVNAVKEQHPDLNVELFDPFVHVAGGDFEQAYEAYANFVSQFRQEPEAPAQTAPAVVNSGSTTSAPPVEKEYANLGDAIEDFVAQRGLPPQAQEAPKTVGSS